ncbi:FecR/PupR family sigma factor regulator [Methylobacillus glycogenes]|uniref:FecR/PupR family sigma factor regulator n=1 Tax=Methylobacillus glycogenes TaxID=406 RepID=UPI0009DE28FE
MSNLTLKRTARQAAIRWFVLMQDADIEHPQRSTFEHWLLSDPAHQQAITKSAHSGRISIPPPSWRILKAPCSKKPLSRKPNAARKSAAPSTAQLASSLWL